MKKRFFDKLWGKFALKCFWIITRKPFTDDWKVKESLLMALNKSTPVTFLKDSTCCFVKSCWKFVRKLCNRKQKLTSFYYFANRWVVWNERFSFALYSTTWFSLFSISFFWRFSHWNLRAIISRRYQHSPFYFVFHTSMRVFRTATP